MPLIVGVAAGAAGYDGALTSSGLEVLGQFRVGESKCADSLDGLVRRIESACKVCMVNGACFVRVFVSLGVALFTLSWFLYLLLWFEA